jgi:hypothetical protein
MTRRRTISWIVVPLPARDLAELVLEMAAPLLENLGSPTPRACRASRVPWHCQRV